MSQASKENLVVEVEGEREGVEISPSNAPIKELIDTLSAIRSFIYKTSKTPDSSIAEIGSGSLSISTKLPSDTSSYLIEARRRGYFKASEPFSVLVSSLENIASKYNFSVKIKYSDFNDITITPNGSSNFKTREAVWVNTVLVINGILIEMGGKVPNIHVDTEEYGIVKIDIDYIPIKTLKLYEKYVFEVDSRQNWDSEKEVKGLIYRSHIHLGGPIAFGLAIKDIGSNWNKDAENDLEWFEKARGRL